MAILPAEMYAAIVETNTEETNEIVKKLWRDAWTVAYYAGCAFFGYAASQRGEAETVGIRRSADYFARTLAANPDACNRSINKWIQCSHKLALLLRVCVYCPTLLLPLLKALNTSTVRLYFFLLLQLYIQMVSIQITSLDLQQTSITDDAFTLLNPLMPKITRLDLSLCPLLSGKYLCLYLFDSHILLHFSQDASIVTLIRKENGLQLKSFNASGSGVGVLTVDSLFSSCPALESLVLGNKMLCFKLCVRMTDSF
jgi:hypothetical protein